MTTPKLPCPNCGYVLRVDRDVCPCGKTFSVPEQRERWERAIHYTGLPTQTTLDES